MGEEQLPLADVGVRAGFPSPAQDLMDVGINLSEALVEHPATTFIARVSGHSMIGAGIQDGDLLVIDRSLDAQEGDIVVCCLNGDFTVKRLGTLSPYLQLLPENPDYPIIEVLPEDDFMVWGVVTYVIHKTKH